jgi:hypothetical protein
MRGPDGLNDKAVLAGDESATIPRIDPLALQLEYFLQKLSKVVFSTGPRYFFSTVVLIAWLQMAKLWVLTAKCYVGVAQVSPPYSRAGQ